MCVSFALRRHLPPLKANLHGSEPAALHECRNVPCPSHSFGLCGRRTWLAVCVFSQVRELTTSFNEQCELLRREVAAAGARADMAEAREKATRQQLENQEAELAQLQKVATDITLLQEAKQVRKRALLLRF